MSDFMTRMRELSTLFWRGAKETGETAAEMIEQRTSIQRLSLQIRRLDKERSTLLRQIGAKVYGLHGQGKVRNQDVLVDCQRIDAILQQISKLQQEIEAIRRASRERGIEIPVLADETPLDDEPEVVATPAATVTPAGTIGQQDLPEGGTPKASDGRVEFDESGDDLVKETPGPSAPSGSKVAAACAEECPATTPEPSTPTGSSEE